MKNEYSLLEMISIKSNVDLNTIVDKYNYKVSDYCLRDDMNNKSVQWLKATPQRQRAINTLFNAYIKRRTLYEKIKQKYL